MSRGMTRPAFPQREMESDPFPSLRGFMSTWTIVLSVGTLVNFENPTPRVMIRSASSTSFRACGAPTFPSTPTTHSWSSGRIPLAR